MVACFLWGAGVLLTAWEDRLSREAKGATSSARTPAEMLFARAGAIQPLLADWFWLRANRAWEARDEQDARLWLRLTVATEPSSSYFRANAARMIAFDFPRWAEARDRSMPLAVRRARNARYATEALAWLFERGAGELAARDWIEAGNISLYGQEDLALAAGFYRTAAELPDAPWYAGRICAALLERAGRPCEALVWLRQWAPGLPADDPAAGREIVMAWIARLEDQCGSTEAF